MRRLQEGLHPDGQFRKAYACSYRRTTIFVSNMQEIIFTEWLRCHTLKVCIVQLFNDSQMFINQLLMNAKTV